jgi:hypothetical protein
MPNERRIKMKNIQFTFLGFAVAAAISLMLIGVFIAENSLVGVISAIIALIVIMGLGFSTKKKMRENGKLK